MTPDMSLALTVEQWDWQYYAWQRGRNMVLRVVGDKTVLELTYYNGHKVTGEL